MNKRVTKWTPTTQLSMLRRMGKLLEELNECGSVAARCIIQGIDEVDPSSQRVNRDRLGDEMADVLAQIECTVAMLDYDRDALALRVERKLASMAAWEAMFPPEGSEVTPVFVVDHVGSSYGDGMQHTTVLVGHSLCRRALQKGAKLYEQPPKE